MCLGRNWEESQPLLCPCTEQGKVLSALTKLTLGPEDGADNDWRRGWILIPTGAAGHTILHPYVT